MSTETIAPFISAGQKAAADVSALLRARCPIIWIETSEESRVEQYVLDAAAKIKYVSHAWDVAAGITDVISGKEDPKFSGTVGDCGVAFGKIREAAEKKSGAERGVWIMRDLAVWIPQGMPGAMPVRQLRNLAKFLPTVPRDKSQAIVILSTTSDVPSELQNYTSVIKWPLPDRTEIEMELDAALASLGDTEAQLEGCPADVRYLAIDAAVGLTADEAAACYARSLVQSRKIDPTIVANEKKRVISRGGGLEWFDPLPEGLEAVGGLDDLKDWAIKRKAAYSVKAREYGLTAPKGVGLVGVPGCGKSLFAKAIATVWGVPLLRLDLNALKDKYVGASEGNIRKTLDVIKAIGRCVVWIDEIEKALAGSNSGGASDGGVSTDALGVILSWMQERTSEAFVIATANDIEALPPELFRKGRFDDVFFINLPNETERAAVLKTALNKAKRGALKIDYTAVVEATEDFSGSEVAELVPAAMVEAFEDDAREITTEDLVAAAHACAPMAKTQSTKIERLRKWAKDNGTRPATKAVAETTKRVRKLDLAV